MGTETILANTFEGVPSAMVIPTAIGFIIGCLLAAFFSFRFFKLSIVLIGAFLGFSFGSEDLGMLVSDRIDGVNTSLILGIACALVFAILAPKFYKICIYLLGGIIGGAIGYMLTLNVLVALGSSVRIIIIPISLILAFFGAKLVYRFFKPYLIISSSIIGSICAATLTATLIFGENEIVTGIFAILGLILSIVAMRAQFRMNRGRSLDL